MALSHPVEVENVQEVKREMCYYRDYVPEGHVIVSCLQIGKRDS